MEYKLIKDQTVINSIEWDGEATYTVPEDTTLVQNSTAGIGDKYIDGKFYRLVDEEWVEIT